MADTKVVKPVRMEKGEPVPEKEHILAYMRGCKVFSVAARYFRDPETGVPVGEDCWMEDREYCWSSETVYLFDRYDFPLPEEFIRHVMKTVAEK